MSAADRTAMLGRPALRRAAVPASPAPDRAAIARAEPAGDSLGQESIEIDFDRAPLGAGESIRLVEDRADPVPIPDFLAGVVEAAADTMAMLAQHRAVRAMEHRNGREARILALADAVFASGEGAMAHLLRWWEGARSMGDPWAIWPAVFLLGLIEGPDGLGAIERLIEALGPEDRPFLFAASDALMALPHPGLPLLGRDLLASGSPLARAAGLETIARREPPDPDLGARHLGDRSPEVVAAALRALVRISGPSRPVDRARALLDHPDTEVAWEAARALTLWGSPDAIAILRDGGPLAATLGARAAELFVMAGDAGDIPHLEAIVRRCGVSEELLHGIGRFGHPLAWSFLLHFLAHRDLGDAAEQALLAIFGPLVPPEERRRASAWREALAEHDWDASARYRGGEPWTIAAIVRECASGELSRLDLERRLDEVGARAGLLLPVDLALWTPDAEALLSAALERARATKWSAGAYRDPR